ncbi:MerR family transcriptional regulator [Streptococcus equi]|uniref:MerR family transcriptional regulator n=1 Tax=Streptococcus equi subsp. ruminatorum TaxID=254358 RepID=A0A6M1L697_9STRE|nr:MerR family transcriptional regulator [Streptococcus equi]NGL83667.1 MerR family transcriptional regulator [Streptococcus equi subsp. ruminatorum]
MSDIYSTGELAKAAGVTIRTVQYYDNRNLLSPSAITDGGRRQYTSADLSQLKRILFLRELDFSIERIKRIFAEDNTDQVLELLLQEHIRQLRAEAADKKAKLDRAVKLLKEVEKDACQSLDDLSDLALRIENQESWRQLQHRTWPQLILAIISYVLVMVLATWLRQIWLIWLGMSLFILAVNGLVWHYKKQVLYLCPNCHKIFEPTYKAFSLAGHTPKTRRLRCPHCQQKSYCLELAKEK